MEFGNKNIGDGIGVNDINRYIKFISIVRKGVWMYWCKFFLIF